MRPAFVVTMATISQFACDSSQPANTPTTTVDVSESAATATATATSSATASASADADNARTRPVKEVQWEQYQGKLGGDEKTLNPNDGEGRMIFARRDGHCYVIEPLPPEQVTRMRAGIAKVVDCPDAMQHEAWDTCLGGTLQELDNGDCICRVGGNPPPPPAKAVCPPKS